MARESAPPHTRGSTLPAGIMEHQVLGSPAHAGIDLFPIRSRSSRAWLPRTRGDRPLLDNGFHFFREAPPHTRGSTFWAENDENSK